MPSAVELLLAKKNLNPDLFNKADKINLEMLIEAHVAWVYNSIYSQPYPGIDKPAGIARVYHGIQHVTRAALYIAIFANLYKLFGNTEAIALSDEDIKLLQIAALFHDSAREDEEVDYWDQDSALIFYHYATNILLLAPSKAKELAEAIANKDSDTINYFELLNGEWVRREGEFPRNIYQKLIHDADCLEIIRVRDHFDAHYLDFYKDIAESNEEALDLLAKLITEARSLIAYQGDAYRRLNLSIKLKYEHQHAYRDISACIEQHPEHHPLIRALSHNKSYLAPQLKESTGITELSLTEAMNSGRLFVRGIGAPASIHNNRIKTECAGALEVRKMRRRLGTPTPTLKSNRKAKFGNPNRSVTMLSHGVGVFASQGFLILNPEVEHISAVSDRNFRSGFGKKNTLQIPQYSQALIEEQLKGLHRQLKMGGTSIDHGKYATTHNEILYRMTKADAIYFTQDPTPYNEMMFNNDFPCNSKTHYLQALFLQIEYEKATGEKLPIFEYSGVHHFIKATPNYTEEDIVAMWVEIVSNLMNKDINTYRYCFKSLEDLKILAIDGYIGENSLIKKQINLDVNYPIYLQEKINKAIEEERIGCLISSISDGNLLCKFLRLSLKQLESKQRDLIWEAVEGQLGPLIENVDQLSSLLDLSLQELNAIQREKIWDAVKNHLGTLIKSGYDLSRLLNLSLEKLNSKQQEQIWDAVKNQLGTLIKNGYDLSYLLFFSFDKLNGAQKDLIWEAVEGQFGSKIKDIGDLYHLFALPLEKLNSSQREYIFAAIEKDLGTLIKDIKDLNNLLQLPVQKLSPLHRNKILTVVTAQVGTLIKSKEDLYHLFQLGFVPYVLDKIIAVVDGKLGTMIENADQLFDFLDIPGNKLNSSQKDRILTALADQLGTIIEDGDQLWRLFNLPLDQLNSQQRDLIFKAVESHLGTLIKNSNQLWCVFSLPLDKLNYQQRDLIFKAIESQLGTLIKNAVQLYGLLLLPREKLNTIQVDGILTVLADQLGTIIKDGDQLCHLFNLPLIQLNYQQRDLVFRSIEGQLGSKIQNATQLYNLLKQPRSKLNPLQKDKILTNLFDQLGTIIKDRNQLWSLVMLDVECLNFTQRYNIFRGIENHLGSLIKDEQQLSYFLIGLSSQATDRFFKAFRDQIEHKNQLINSVQPSALGLFSKSSAAGISGCEALEQAPQIDLSQKL